MSFEVIPAVDVAGGRLVRTSIRGAEPVSAFGGDPIAAAKAFVAAGAGWLHVVDVDRARSGVARNLDLLRAACGMGVRIQASGGVTTPAHVEEALAAGASRVVLGSAALADRAATADLVERFGAALVVGIEVDGAAIRPRGAGPLDLSLREALAWLRELPVERFLLTPVGRVGNLAGPDLSGAVDLARATGRPVIVAGGVRDAGDVRRLALEAAIAGVVVGRALYEGVNLSGLLAAAAEADPGPPAPVDGAA